MWNSGAQIPAIDASGPAAQDHPARLFVETTTRCNLGCVMCVKQTDGCQFHEADMSLEIFSSLASSFPHLKALILNGIGEPLLNPHLETFIRLAKPLMPKHSWIGFQSNGALLTDLRAIALVDAGLDRICISIDAASPELFHHLREGGDLTEVERALAAMNNAKQVCGRPEVALGVEYVVMRKNLNELPLALKWAAERGAGFAIVTHVLPYEEQHADEAVYSLCTAEAIALFQKCAAEIAGQGLDIRNYFEARWKYARTAAEQRLVDLVEEMKQRASELNLFVDMKKLLNMDHHQADQVAQVFDEAGRVAAEYGLDLRLPNPGLSNQRHCGFVEDGGVFIAVDGDVSPCYFLWHRYCCFASGWKQKVAPKVFGNVLKGGLLQIWNSSPYRAFRDKATAYDFPACSNCTLAPCDYVQTDNFEQDCHIGDVPCGACLWCMGVFQCLR